MIKTVLSLTLLTLGLCRETLNLVAPSLAISHFSKAIWCCRCLNFATTTRIWKMRVSSLDVHGAHLLNCLPRRIRNISGCSMELFNSYLDRFSKFVLDEPLVPGYTMMRRADLISLLDLPVFVKNLSFEVKDPTIDQAWDVKNWRISRLYHQTVLDWKRCHNKVYTLFWWYIRYIAVRVYI